MDHNSNAAGAVGSASGQSVSVRTPTPNIQQRQRGEGAEAANKGQTASESGTARVSEKKKGVEDSYNPQSFVDHLDRADISNGRPQKKVAVVEAIKPNSFLNQLEKVGAVPAETETNYASSLQMASMFTFPEVTDSGGLFSGKETAASVLRDIHDLSDPGLIAAHAGKGSLINLVR